MCLLNFDKNSFHWKPVTLQQPQHIMGACSPWPTFQSAVSEHRMGRCSNPDTAVLGHIVILEQVFFCSGHKKLILDLQLQDLLLQKSVSEWHCIGENLEIQYLKNNTGLQWCCKFKTSPMYSCKRYWPWKSNEFILVHAVNGGVLFLT